LNAVGNMRLLEHFDQTWFSKFQQRKASLHLWVPPTPGDPGVTIGAAWLFAHLARAARRPDGPRILLRYSPSHQDVATALKADDIASQRIGDISTPEGRDAVADLMHSLWRKTASSRCIRVRPKPGRARSAIARSLQILAIPKRVSGSTSALKYREAIRRWRRWRRWRRRWTYFDLLQGASDGDYNAYNYMVLTARSKPHARGKIPAVIHADGTGRIQIARRRDDALTYAYLKALGRRIASRCRSTPPSTSPADRADPKPSDRYAAPFQGPRRGAVGGERRRGLRGMARGNRDSGRFTEWFSEWKIARTGG